jgi:uncharacterized membrane protein (DUF485 family)
VETNLAQRIARDPNYQKLRSRRNRLGWTLTLLMMIVYYGFIVLVAFDKPFLAQRMGEGVMTLGIPIGFGVIVFTIIITYYYVRRANAEFDSLTEAIAKAALK